MDWGWSRAVCDCHIVAHSCEWASRGVGCVVKVRIERNIERPGPGPRGKWDELLFLCLELGCWLYVACGGEDWLEALLNESRMQLLAVCLPTTVHWKTWLP